MPAMTTFDVRILGTGIVSRVAALSLARIGLNVALQARPSGAAPSVDVRTYALNPASVQLLEGLKVWSALPEVARTAVLDMRVQGDAHASRVEFSAWQQAVPALAWIVDAGALENVLDAAAGFTPQVTLQAEPAPAPLTLVAEGKASATRALFGARFVRHAYGHTAVAARLVSDRPHAGCARQWFRAPDILGLLPFDSPQAGCSYGLVWSLPQAQAQHWLSASAEAFEAGLMDATGGEAGTLRLSGERAAWPLALGHAEPVTGTGWALLGDAAHQVHPLAGQGLNLGLADVVALADTLAEREVWRGLGDPVLLRRYARRRLVPNWAMAQLTDGLWHLFARENPGWRELRNRGMSLVNHLPPLKRWLATQALDV